MEQQNTTAPQRPGMLTALCILTFIWSGAWTLLSLIGIFASGWISSFFSQYLGTGGGGIIGSYFAIVMIVLFILWGLSLFGAIKMFGLKKSGYIIYMIPNCLMLLLQIIGMLAAFTVGSFIYLLISILFIVLYGMNLKFMK